VSPSPYPLPSREGKTINVKPLPLLSLSPFYVENPARGGGEGFTLKGEIEDP